MPSIFEARCSSRRRKRPRCPPSPAVAPAAAAAAETVSQHSLGLVPRGASVMSVIILSSMLLATAPVGIVVAEAQSLKQEETSSEPPAACTSTEFIEDPCRPDWLLDGFCDNGDKREDTCYGPGRDCFDCDPCQSYSYSCEGCIRQEGCYWCPGDAICMSQPLEQDFWSTTSKLPKCINAEDWLADTCNSPLDEDNVYSDSYYTAMQWVYDLIRVEPVWQEGITGRGVHIRINDNGVDSFHPEFIANFQYDTSCQDDYRPRDTMVDRQGTAVASIAAGDANGACSVGIAHAARLSSCNVYSSEDLPYVFNSQLELATTAEGQVDISSNSWSLPASCRGDTGDTGGLIIQQRRQWRQRGRNLQQEMEDDASNNNDCPFDQTNPNSPCQFCQEEFGSTINTVRQENYTIPGIDCERAIILYCSLRYNHDIACQEYLDLFVECQYHVLDATTLDQLVLNIVEGRNKKGVIFVVPAGDTNLIAGNTNMNGYVHSRFTIAVAAVDQQGRHASYSTPGAAVLVSAPGGDKQYVSNNIVANPGGGCTDAGYGTAMAVPVVSGVAALMLEVNPLLGWRDVMAILTQTAYMPPELVEAEDWTVNDGGYAHSYKHGFGIVDATAAVAKARDWVVFPKEEQILVEGDDNILVGGDNNSTFTATGQVEFINPFFRIESVVVYVNMSLPRRRGDMKVTLTSPTGIESILAPSKVPEKTSTDYLKSQGVAAWKFLTVRYFWEYPGGQWTLTVEDESPPAPDECVDLDWYLEYSVGDSSQVETLRCWDFDAVSSCDNALEVNPDAMEVEYQGRTIFDACCKCGGGVLASELVGVPLKSWRMMIHGHVSAGGSSEVVDVAESTCEFNNDTCPTANLFNHVCDDNLLYPECGGNDCFDCDVCQVFNYDCASCVEAGCNWCPGDATCLSTKLDAPFWKLNSHKTTSCGTASDWVNTCDPIREENVFNDPLYDAMSWIYQQIDIEPVWRNDFTGLGVHIRINDDGVDGDHLELADNFDGAYSCIDSRPVDPELDVHGTAIASIVAGKSNNGLCATGIAPGATISSCVGPSLLADAPELLLSRLDTVDISVNSWSPVVCHSNARQRSRKLQQCIFSTANTESPCEVCNSFQFPGELSAECVTAVSKYCRKYYEDDPVACAEYLDVFVSCEYHLLPLEAHASFVKAITEGRQNKGIIFIFSAGNTHTLGVDTNVNGFINSRFTIAVGAVGKDGRHASYSTSGAAVFVAAPGGDFDQISGFMVAKPGGGCHDIAVGTSFSAPVVAGVVAQILQVNPNLGWRDVQNILAATSQTFDPSDSSWVTNAAGYKHSYKYGFGVVKATDALTIASTWDNLGAEQQQMHESGVLNVTITDDPNETVVSSVTVTEWTDGFFVTESVVVYVDVQHPSRGDLKIVLTSPQGTESILHPSKRPENTQLEGDDVGKWKLLTLRAWGEDPAGNWTLRLIDESPGNYGDCFDLPWEFTYESVTTFGNETLTCTDFATVTDCFDKEQVNPQILNVEWKGLNIADSCCSCGGGIPSSSIAPMLRSWRLMVYGHTVASKDDIFVPLQPSTPIEGVDEGVAGGEEGVGADASEGSSTLNPVSENDRGNIGALTGGGGTAYMSDGWRGKDTFVETTQFLLQSSSLRRRLGEGSYYLASSIAFLLL